ncbi:MAG: molybdate ABC transporter permease subunit, partial [bacterium]
MDPQVQIIFRSLKVATLSTALIIPVGAYLGWLFSRKEFAGKSLLDGLVNIPLVLPPVVTGYLLLIFLGPNSVIGHALSNLFRINIAFTWWAAVIAAAVVSFPLLVRSVRVA